MTVVSTEYHVFNTQRDSKSDQLSQPWAKDDN